MRPMRPMHSFRALTLLAFAALAACGGKSDPPPGSPTGPSGPAAPAPAAPTGPRMSFRSEPPKTKGLEVAVPFVANKDLENLIELVNQIFVLPRDLVVTAKECGMPNAFYRGKDHTITLCYELPALFAEKVVEVGKRLGSTEEQMRQTVKNAMLFTFFHELAHALIGELELGVTGGEEDAADDLAGLIFIAAKRADIAIDGAIGMLAFEAGKKPAYADEHSFGEQRYYNIMCLALGSDPERFGAVLVPKFLPKERAVRCKGEHERKKLAWNVMLDAHATAKVKAAGGSLAKPKPPGPGRFVVNITPPPDEKLSFIVPFFALDKIGKLVDGVNTAFGLPQDVVIQTKLCGQPNAFYHSGEHSITLCYELPIYFFDSLKKTTTGLSNEVLLEGVKNAMLFTFLHELGHALVAELELGITGGEEDAVDDFAAVFLTKLNAATIASDGAIAMLSIAGDPAKPKFWDEHSFGQQRFYNILCVILGSDIERFAQQMVPALIPQERAVRCKSEYTKKEKAWSALLNPRKKS